MNLDRKMPASRTERISIAEVAKAANVSIQTVSRVVNEQPGVSLKTRERVRKLIGDLGYYPSRAARALRGSSRTLGVVGYGLELYGPSRTLVGAQLEARRNNYGIVLELVSDPVVSDPRAILENMLSAHVDGIIWCIPDIADNIRSVATSLAKISVPVIFTDTSATMHDLTVTNNNYQGGRLATRHLLDSGHPHVGIITGPLTYFSARERLRGWRDTLQEAGLSADDSWFIEGDWNAASGAAGLRTLRERHSDLSAVFAGNDQMGLGVLHAAECLNLSVPRDIAVVGYDDIPEAEFFHPALSSVHQDVVNLGASAVSQMIRAIDSLALRGHYSPETTAIEPQLVVRASSMPG